VNDYFQLAFGKEVGMSIYNPMEITPPAPIDSLIGKKVLSVTEDESAIEIQFDGSTKIKIDMRDNAYVGPEALALYREGHSPVIWN
jgi:hypothetical protein